LNGHLRLVLLRIEEHLVEELPELVHFLLRLLVLGTFGELGKLKVLEFHIEGLVEGLEFQKWLGGLVGQAEIVQVHLNHELLQQFGYEGIRKDLEGISLTESPIHFLSKRATITLRSCGLTVLENSSMVITCELCIGLN
jgi:hypothetical protein